MVHLQHRSLATTLYGGNNACIAHQGSQASLSRSWPFPEKEACLAVPVIGQRSASYQPRALLLNRRESQCKPGSLCLGTSWRSFWLGSRAPLGAPLPIGPESFLIKACQWYSVSPFPTAGKAGFRQTSVLKAGKACGDPT